MKYTTGIFRLLTLLLATSAGVAQSPSQSAYISSTPSLSAYNAASGAAGNAGVDADAVEIETAGNVSDGSIEAIGTIGHAIDIIGGDLRPAQFSIGVVLRQHALRTYGEEVGAGGQVGTAEIR